MGRFLPAIAAAAGSFLLGFIVHRGLHRWNVVDQPKVRSSHTQPTVRGGGVAILMAWAVGVTACGLSPVVIVWLLTVILLAVISFVDDWRTLPVLVRFGHHAVVAIVMIAVLYRPAFHLEWPWPLVVLGAAWLWVTGYINAFNFMDGINGLATIQAVVTGIGMALVAGTVTKQWNAPPVIFSLVTAGAALGFLPHNFPKARMFMGDVGSASIGFILATLVLWLTADLGSRLLVPLLLLHANYVLDTGITLVRRVLRGDRWHEAHREHFYQRLVRSGCTHSQVTLAEAGLQSGVLVMVLVFPAGPIAQGILIAVVLALWAGFFAWAEKRFRRAAA